MNNFIKRLGLNPFRTSALSNKPEPTDFRDYSTKWEIGDWATAIKDDDFVGFDCSMKKGDSFRVASITEAVSEKDNILAFWLELPKLREGLFFNSRNFKKIVPVADEATTDASVEPWQSKLKKKFKNV